MEHSRCAAWKEPAGKTLFACDEMAGFSTAASLVRPTQSVLDLEASPRS